MAFLMIYPAVAILSLFVLMVIILILRFGARWCKLRHSTFADQECWHEEAYEQKVSYA
ncbi:uncharacterized protein LOC116777993 [Danaus plexippus]|uniref:uncharacterized protein LOC116777993 n=1 Tax=Danaus plexippus TaxID=13037 RepID=UPI0013C3EE68|nr:uncharacterized protein LOC116777993 [Danaus plexippus]